MPVDLPSLATALLREPDTIHVYTDDLPPMQLMRAGGGRWHSAVLELRIRVSGPTLHVTLEDSMVAVTGIDLSWNHATPSTALVLADAIERGYGDFAWKPLDAQRDLPWYFLVNHAGITHGAGVRTDAHSVARWRLSGTAVTLRLDTTCGGRGVTPPASPLELASVAARDGARIETAFESAEHLCGMLSLDTPPADRLGPVVGINDWYYSYGTSTADTILRDATTLMDLCCPTKIKPWVVIDDGWQAPHAPPFNGGPWHAGKSTFVDLAGLAAKVRALGARPAIWYRPLLTSAEVPELYLHPASRGSNNPSRTLDPSVPEVLDLIAGDLRRFREWGFEGVKYDFTTFDTTGRWGFQMADGVCAPGWAFADESKTTAMILRELYRTIRSAADDLMLIGCNTVNHLAIGAVDIARTGDDVSGRDFATTLKMGVNSLAYRMPQQGRFFAADADCVPVTQAVPWRQTREWLELVANSGTPLFASIAPDALGIEQRAALREAFTVASTITTRAEPLDWISNPTPNLWKIDGTARSFNWK
ncbi:MAG: hypothetical protein QM770_02970 [Tepidisphaeraceae bacterium]